MKFSIALLFSLLLTTTFVAQSPFVGLSAVELSIPPSTASTIQTSMGWSELPRCYRVYACLDEPLWELQAQFGDQSTPWIIEGNFYQSPIGSAVSSEINPAFFPVIPELEFDSWFTISNNPYSAPINFLENPTEPVLEQFETGIGFIENSVTGSAIFGAWSPGASEGLPNAEGKILLGQFTVQDNLSGTFNMQFRRLNPDLSVATPVEVVQESVAFSVETLDVTCSLLGCDDTDACNYQPGTIGTGGCLYPGCTDFEACNWDPSTSCGNDNLCVYPGCLDPAACNYDSEAECDGGDCTYPGCNQTLACNYNPSAGCDDGSCLFPGCTDSQACNFSPSAGCDDGTCIASGCTDPDACNYDETAGCENGSCTYPGCNDPTACNYDLTAGCSDFSCTYPGCTDFFACNYDWQAGCDDGSCAPASCCEVDQLSWSSIDGFTNLSAEGVVGLPGNEVAVLIHATSPQPQSFVIKLSAELESEWTLPLNVNDLPHHATCLDISPLGVLMVGGQVQTENSPAFIAEISALGIQNWTTVSESGETETLRDIQSSVQGIYAAGSRGLNSSEDGLIWKLDTAGTSLWMNVLDNGNQDVFTEVALFPDGKLVAGGSSIGGDDPFGDGWIAAMSSSGEWLGQTFIVEGDLENIYHLEAFADSSISYAGFHTTDPPSYTNFSFAQKAEFTAPYNGTLPYAIDLFEAQSPIHVMNSAVFFPLDDMFMAAGYALDPTSGERLPLVALSDINSTEIDYVQRCILNQPGMWWSHIARGTDDRSWLLGQTTEDAVVLGKHTVWQADFLGCSDPFACNYDGSNGIEYWNCEYPESGFDCSGNCIGPDTDGDGVCDFLEIEGCTFPGACNYNPSATEENGTCFFATAVYDCNGECQSDSDNDGICDQNETTQCQGPECCLEGTVWDPVLQGCIPLDLCPADLTGDGQVDAEDILEIIGSYGTECP